MRSFGDLFFSCNNVLTIVSFFLFFYKLVMVRTKAKKSKGDDAFTKRKQKTGRKKLAPVTDTRAEVHARSLYVSTPSVISKETQYLNNAVLGKNEEDHGSGPIFSCHGSGQKESVKELLRGATHYKSSHRSSCYASVARMMLQAERRRKADRIAKVRRGMVSSFPVLKRISGIDQEKGKTSELENLHEKKKDEGEQDKVEPMEKLRAFSLALEAMTDTDDAVRRSALTVLQALFSEGWVCPHTPQEEALYDQALLYRYYRHQQEDTHSSPDKLATTESSRDVVWMLVSSSQCSKSSLEKQKEGHVHVDRNGGSSVPRTAFPSLKSSSLSSHIPVVCAALSTLHANRTVPVLYQTAARWREEVGVVSLEELLEEMGEETVPRPLGGTDNVSNPSVITPGRASSSPLLPFSRLPNSVQESAAEKIESRRAAQKVALENVTAILHTVYICLTHAFNPVRWTGIELLEYLLLLLQLEGRRLASTEGEDHYQGLFRQACRMVCRKQSVASLSPTSFPLSPSHGKEKDNSENHITGASSASFTPSRLSGGSSEMDHALESSYNEEIWMLHLLRRVSHMVLHTPHLPVLPSLVDALLLSSPSSNANCKVVNEERDEIFLRKMGGREEHYDENPVDILASLTNFDTNRNYTSFSSTAGNLLGALWSPQATTTTLSIASSSEWCHPHLVQSAFAHVFLSSWSIAWKELMDQRLNLLRQEHGMARAIALARVVGTVTTFLHFRYSPHLSHTPSRWSSTLESEPSMEWEARFPSPFSSPSTSSLNPSGAAYPQHYTQCKQKKKEMDMKAKECRQILVDVFVRQIPFSLPGVLQNNIDKGTTVRPSVNLMSTSIEQRHGKQASSSSLPSPGSMEEVPQEKESDGEEETEEMEEDKHDKEILNEGPGGEVNLFCDNNEKQVQCSSVPSRKRERATSVCTGSKGETPTAVAAPNPDSHRRSRHSVSSKLLSHQFALAQALAMVAAPLASYFPDALKLLQTYFTFMFPSPVPPSSQATNFPLKAGSERQAQALARSEKSAVPLTPPLEALSGALSILLLVLQLHQPRSSPSSIILSKSSGPSRNVKTKKSSRNPVDDAQPLFSSESSGAFQRLREQEQYRLQTYQKMLLFSPGVVAVVLKAMKQYSTRSTGCYFPEDRYMNGDGQSEGRSGRGLDTYGKLQLHLAVGDSDLCGMCSTTALSSTDTALIHLLLCVRQLLVALAQYSTTFCSFRYPSFFNTQVTRASSSLNPSGMDIEVFKSLHRVWLALPRLLFSLRLQIVEKAYAPASIEGTENKAREGKGEESLESCEGRESEEKSTRQKNKSIEVNPLPMENFSHDSRAPACFSTLSEKKVMLPVGPLPSHPALIDVIVFSYLHTMWSMVRHQHVILQCSSNEGEAVRAIMLGEGTDGASTRAPSCFEVLRSTLSSLKGFSISNPSSSDNSVTNAKPTIVHGVLSRCSLVTRRLAQRLAFYLGDTVSDFMMQSPSHHHISEIKKGEDSFCDVPHSVPELDMVSVANHLNEIISRTL